MSGQVVQLTRSDKTYLAGIRAVRRELNAYAAEFNWLDKNIELIKSGKKNELYKLWVIVR